MSERIPKCSAQRKIVRFKAEYSNNAQIQVLPRLAISNL